MLHAERNILLRTSETTDFPGMVLYVARLRILPLTASHPPFVWPFLPRDREHGKWYTVWQDDPEDPTGYRLLKTTTERPVGETLDDIYNIANGLQGEDEAPEFLGSLAKFVRDFRAM